jgi:DNA replication protein DnaC
LNCGTRTQHGNQLITGTFDVQENVERLVASGQNVFFTGNAGTGKSFLLNR